YDEPTSACGAKSRSAAVCTATLAAKSRVSIAGVHAVKWRASSCALAPCGLDSRPWMNCTRRSRLILRSIEEATLRSRRPAADHGPARPQFRHRLVRAPPRLPVPRRDLRRRSDLLQYRGVVARDPRGGASAQGPAVLSPARREREDHLRGLRVRAEPAPRR